MKEPEFRVFSYFCSKSGENKYCPQKKVLGVFWWNLCPPRQCLEDAYSFINAKREFLKSRKSR